MRRSHAKLFAFVMVGLTQLFPVGPGRTEVVDRIVAEVNDEIITMSELQVATKGMEAQMGIKPKSQEDREFQRQALDALIDRKLAKAEAKKRGITLTDKELAEGMARFMKRNNLPDEEALNKALSQAGLTLKEVKQQIQDQMIQERLLVAAVGAKAVVREADVRKAYDEMAKEGLGGMQVHLRALRLVYPSGATEAQKEGIKQKAEDILKEVKQGASFTEVAGRAGAEQEDMGYVALSDINPALAGHLAKLKPKDVVPVQTPEGFQLFQLVDRRSGQPRSYEEVAPEIRNMLVQRELEKYFMEWVKTLRAKAHIKIML
jgi:peptidyl-prolyl cis-trans isomerase SurA